MHVNIKFSFVALFILAIYQDGLAPFMGSTSKQ
jgi:hypothetical protein